MDKVEKYFVIRDIDGYWQDDLSIVSSEISFERAKETADRYMRVDYGTPEPEVTVYICAVVKVFKKSPKPVLKVVD